MSKESFKIVLGRYFMVVTPAHLIWEFGHMPLYTLWLVGSAGEIAFAAIHCTGGDLLIAAFSLALAVVLLGGRAWPREKFVSVATGAILFGLLYTGFSEWLNIEVRESWAYREIMPRLPVVGLGVTPFLQWLIVPALGFWYAGQYRKRS